MNINQNNLNNTKKILDSVLEDKEDDTIPYADSIEQQQPLLNSTTTTNDNVITTRSSLPPVLSSSLSVRPEERKRKSANVLLNSNNNYCSSSQIIVEPIIHSSNLLLEDQNNNENHENQNSEMDDRSQSSKSDDTNTELPGHLVNVNKNQNHVNLRRNSISLPMDLNKLNALQEAAMQSSEQTIIDTDNAISLIGTESRADSIIIDTGCEDESNNSNINSTEIIINDKEDENEIGIDEETKPIVYQLFRNKRRASIAPLPAIKLNDKEMLGNDYDTHSVMSNQNSITSINSLAGLLKEKMQAFPQMIRKKKKETKDYKIKVFVIILFFIIVFLVGYSYIMYHQKVLTRSYFEKAKFSKAERLFRIYNDKGNEIITGNLGITFTADQPFHCHEEDMLNDGSVCLEWNGISRLYMNYENHDVFRCYTIKWQSLNNHIYPTDCYDLTSRRNGGGTWFGGGVTKNADWPLNTANFKFTPFISGDAKIHQFGNAVKRYFINSRGVAIQIHDKTPLYLSVNNTSNKICLRAMNDDFAFVNRLTELPELSYKICVADEMRSLHRLLTQQSLWDGLKDDDVRRLHSLIEEPVWRIHAKNQTCLNETTIYNFSEDVIAMGYMRLGHILVNEFWQENMGDFHLDTERFPSLKSSIDVLHRRGFKISFTLQPFISTDSPNFKDAVRNKLLIYERHSERSIPALTRYKSSSSAGVLDITNNASIPWLINKLQNVIKEYQIDSFYLDLGIAYNLPHYYQCRKTLDNPDMYAKIFTQSLEMIPYIGLSTATSTPRPPAFLSLPPVNASWDGLRTLIISVLNYGILGFPFILPGPIGGDYMLPKNATSKMISFYSLDQPPLPPQELYIRWLQLVTFLPAMQFNHLPSEYKSDYVTDIVKELISIRQRTVIPLLKKYLSDSMNEGLPLIRPLWMLDPHDSACLMVNDEFSVGEELIVAPILEEGAQMREVYLPQGVWKDGVDGSLRKGSRWIHNYRVPKEKIAYFVKMPDNTRF